MTGNIRSFLIRHSSHILFLIALFCTIFAVAAAGRNARLENTRLTHTPPLRLSQDWFARTAEGDVPLAEPSRPAANNTDKTLTLMHAMPELPTGNMSLCFQTKNESVRVFVDDTLVYAYGETPQLVFGHGVGAVWHIAALPDHADGRTLTVELTPVDTRTGLAPYEFLLGDRNGLVTYLLRQKVFLLIVCLVMGIIGVGALAASLTGTLRNASWSTAAVQFALFVLLSAVWTISDSGLLQFVISNRGVSYLLFGGSFYIMGTPFALFMADIRPKYKRIFLTLAAVGSANALVRTILFVTGRVDYETALWTVHVLMALIILFANIALWTPAFLSRQLEHLEMRLAITAYTLVSGFSLAIFYLRDALDVQRDNYASGFYVGILLFVIISIIGVLRQLRRMQQQAFRAAFFEHRAYTDELTGLMNVKGFDDRCVERLREAPAGSCCALVDFDVNFFSQYNANNGVDAGDALLRDIAATLLLNCRENELAARQEADHFICLLCDESLDAILARIREADSAARQHLSTRMLLLSYGVVPVTDHDMPPAALRNQAVVAKRTVKGKYENNIAVYDHDIHEAQLREVALLSGLEKALENDEYVIFLQPKIDVMTEQIGGAEAFVRHIGQDGVVTPAGPIIEALEQKGFVAKLDFFILERVCKLLRRCLDEGRVICPISSNFSRVHLYDPDFPTSVAAVVDRYDVPHSLVEIELTETTFLAGKDALRDTVRRLHERGFQVSVDDFGSGYSSLNMLKDVDIDAVKLDREFLADFAVNRRAGVIIEHTIRLAQQLGITSVAEGIETAGQLRFLRRLGCDLVQGYYYSRPLSEETFIAKYLPPL